MGGHISECSVSLPTPAKLLQNISLQMTALGASIAKNELATVFLFDEGVAVIKPDDGHILIRVAATNVVVSHALRIAFEASIFETSAIAPAQCVWCMV